MRITLLISVLLLAGCATGKPVDQQYKRGRYDMNGAQMYCLSKGYARNSYDYDSCYQNRPQVQAYERDGRMETLSILSANRSPRSKSRSVPIE